MPGPIEDVLIVGGGTAGWLAAAYLARRLGADRPGGVRVTLIESSDIGIIGVGEGTFPSIKKLLLTLGVDEADFMRACSATFKQGIEFIDWEHAPSGDRHNRYYHPFNLPEATESGIDLLPYWLLGLAGDKPLSEAVGLQDKVCDAGRGPKRLDERPFYGAMNYAYHFDAGKLATWLAQVGMAGGVKRLIGTVEAVNLDTDGAIASVSTREHGDLTAGLFIDCTGFRAELIGKALGVEFKDVDNQLFVNRALAMQVPYGRPDHPIATTTISTAHAAGWTWDIGLDDRRGVGYVYSSQHTDDDQAEAVLRRYIGPAAEPLTARQLKFRLGYRERPWVKNCVAIGLAGGFLEPLESTGITMIDMACEMLADTFPRNGQAMEVAARAFNRAMTTRFELAVDFLKLHYGLSKRTDNAFWTDNADRASWSARLRDLIDVWAVRPPSAYDFVSTLDSFPASSYKFVLYGMGFKTDMTGRESIFPYAEQAAREFRRIQVLSGRAVEALPDHRALMDRIYRAA
jgi:tryptophan halogenase